MGDKLNIRGTFVPAPGYTLTAGAIHRIVDEAEVTVDTTGLVAGDGSIGVAASGYSEIPATLQWNPDTACKMVHASAASCINIMPDSFLTRTAVALYPTFSAASNVAHSYKGMPAFFCARTPVGAWPHANGTIVGARHKMSHTPAVSDARSGSVFPIVTGDCKPYLAKWADLWYAYSTSRPAIRHFDHMGIFAQDTDPTQHETQLTEVVISGPAQAMVHVSLSSTFNPNDLFCTYFAYESSIDASADYVMQQPVSWHGSSVTSETRCQIPIGVIRKVYTSSGATMVQMQHGQVSDYSLPAQPYYVADVWLWGQPF